MECVKAGSCSAIRAGVAMCTRWGADATLRASAPLRFAGIWKRPADQPVKIMACDWTGRTKLKEKRYASQVLVTRMPFLPSWKTVHGILSNKANVFRQQSPLTF